MESPFNKRVATEMSRDPTTVIVNQHRELPSPLQFIASCYGDNLSIFDNLSECKISCGPVRSFSQQRSQKDAEVPAVSIILMMMPQAPRNAYNPLFLKYY